MAKWKTRLKSEVKFVTHLVVCMALIYGIAVLIGADPYNFAAAAALAIAVRLDLKQENPDG